MSAVAAARAGELPTAVPVAIAVVASLVGAVLLPLATYTTTLALFGAAHVLSELRYVDVRFGPRLGRTLRWHLGLLLVAVAALRALGNLDVVPAAARVGLEMGLVLLLVIGAIPLLRRAGPGRQALGIGSAAVLGVAVIASPLHALMALAVLHNLTPLGFLAEALRGTERTRALWVGGAVFVAIPLAIATGLPWEAARALGLGWQEAALIAPGTLQTQLGAYLHPAFHDARWALYAFSAAVFAQCMHYGAVIAVLPRLLPDGSPVRGAALAWPAHRPFIATVVVLSAVAAVAFAWSFADARAWYGVFAAVHAWVELPLLLIALVPPSH